MLMDAPQVHIPSATAQPKVVMRALLPSDYPSSSGPVFLLTAHHVSDDALSNTVRELEGMFVPGEGMLYNSVEWLRGQADLWHSVKQPDSDSDSDFGADVEEAAASQVRPQKRVDTLTLDPRRIALHMHGRLLHELHDLDDTAPA